MSGVYPFGPPRPPRDPAGPRVARHPRVDPPVGPRGMPAADRPVPAGPSPSGPVGVAVPSVAAPPATVGAAPAATDLRGQVLEQLLGRAAKYGDRGDSTKTITDLLNAVDMGRAERASSSWDVANKGLTAIGDNYQAALAAALKAGRARVGSGGAGGGGGGVPLQGLTDADYLWLDQYLKSLGGPVTAPRVKPPVKVTKPGDGYGASQHPIAPKKPPAKIKLVRT